MSTLERPIQSVSNCYEAGGRRMQHCSEIFLLVTFPAHTEQRKMGPELGRMLSLIKRRRKIRISQKRCRRREKKGDQFLR